MQPTEWSNTHMQPVTEQPQQVVCMWVVWVLNIHPGWHPNQAKMDYRSWLPTSCRSGLLPSHRKQQAEDKSSSLLKWICPRSLRLSDQKYTFSTFPHWTLCRNESLNCRFHVSISFRIKQQQQQQQRRKAGTVFFCLEEINWNPF